MPQNQHNHNNSDQEQELRMIGQCPVCERRYRSSEATIIRDDGNTMLVYADCIRCRGSVVFAIVRQMGGVIGMVTDMALEDVRRLGDLDPITGDDVLELHEHFVDA